MANLESQGENKAMELLAGSLGNKDLLAQIVALDAPYSPTTIAGKAPPKISYEIIAALLEQDPAIIAALLSKDPQYV